MFSCHERQMAYSLHDSSGSRDGWRRRSRPHDSSIEQQHGLSKVKQIFMKMLKCSAIFGSLLVGALATVLGATVTLTGSDIVKMSKAGISDEVIIQTIQSTGSNFHLTAQDVESFRRNGVSDRVLAAMRPPRPAAPYSAQPGEPTPPEFREPGGHDYIGGLSDQQVVRALPVAPPAYYQVPLPPPYYQVPLPPPYYQAPPSAPYYSYPYYYPSPGYYDAPPVGVYFGYGGWHHHRW